MRIWIVKKLSIYLNWSCNVRRVLSTRLVWVEVEIDTTNAYAFHLCFQRSLWWRFIFFLRWWFKWIASRLSEIEIAQRADRECVENVCLLINCCVTHSCFSSLEVSLCMRNISKSMLSLLVIDLHCLRMMFNMSMIRMRYLIFVCNWFRCRSM